MVSECRTLWDEHGHKQRKAVALLSRVSAAALYLFRLSSVVSLSNILLQKGDRLGQGNRHTWWQ